MGAPGPPGQKGPPGPPVSFTLWVFTVQDVSVYTLGTFTIKKNKKKFARPVQTFSLNTLSESKYILHTLFIIVCLAE